MAGKKLEEQLAALSRLRSEPDQSTVAAALRTALASCSNVLVARAARVAGELELHSLAEALNEAFSRFMGDGVGNDRGCLAKTAIAEAACRTGADHTELLLAGISHVQLEPVYGGKADCAAELRGHCAIGLVQAGHPEVLVHLARLLADPEPEARQTAARAIGNAGQHAGVALLVLKILVGDDDTQVTGESLSSLLVLDPEHGLELAGQLLDADSPELVEAAALALGESRLAAALPVLQRAMEQTWTAATREALLLAIALLRRDEAITYLVSLVHEAPATTAAAALGALATFRHDEQLLARLREVVANRPERTVQEAFALISCEA